MLKSSVGDYSHAYIAYITVKETIWVANTWTEDFAGNNTKIKLIITNFSPFNQSNWTRKTTTKKLYCLYWLHCLWYGKGLNNGRLLWNFL